MRQLTIEDLPRIVTLEQACFTPPVRASRETIQKRLELGHIMLGIEKQCNLIAVISFSYADFSPNDYARFPKTHAELTTQPMNPDANAVFVYNLAVAPSERGFRHDRSLLQETAQQALDWGCTFWVGNSRIPSYAGGDHPEEQIPSSPIVRQAIDRHIDGGPFPATDQLCKDPLLRFYRRLTGGTFLWLQTDFAPEDKASGGMGVVLYGRLDETIKHFGGE